MCESDGSISPFVRRGGDDCRRRTSAGCPGTGRITRPEGQKILHPSDAAPPQAAQDFAHGDPCKESKSKTIAVGQCVNVGRRFGLAPCHTGAFGIARGNAFPVCPGQRLSLVQADTGGDAETAQGIIRTSSRHFARTAPPAPGKSFAAASKNAARQNTTSIPHRAEHHGQPFGHGCGR